MRIEVDHVRLAPLEARKCGKDHRKEYWVRLRKARIGPYMRLGDAKIAVHRIEKILREREDLREDLAKQSKVNRSPNEIPTRVGI